MNRILVSEIFGPVVQGEGPLIGLPTLFLRTGGCDYRCTWCDTLYAVDPQQGKREWERLTTEEVVARVRALAGGAPLWVTLSGGNPAIQPLGPVIDALKPLGYRFAIETQGTVLPDWAGRLDKIVLSPKPPSSGMTTDFDLLDEWVHTHWPVAIKVVVFDDADLDYLGVLRKRYAGQFFAQVGNPDFDETVEPDPAALLGAYRALADLVLERGWYDVAVLPQLHVLAFGGGRGV